MCLPNVQRVRKLYKTILKLHRGLPPALNDLGTKYVRDEFKRHKTCNNKEAEIFINEWTVYTLSLAEQLGLKGPKSGTLLGQQLSESDLRHFRDEQICQLYELLQATKQTDNSR